MWFMMILSWISAAICITFSILSIASGLYYLAELVEEYTTIAGRVIRYLILFSLAVYFLLMIFEDLPFAIIICGFLSHGIHLILLQNFPYFDYSSLPFISGIAFLLINHYLAFSFFAEKYMPFSHVLGYFTICIWMVPVAFFVSLSANDNVLPTSIEMQPLIESDNDVVSSYFSRRSGGRKIGLLSFFNYAKESLLPQRVKKSF